MMLQTATLLLPMMMAGKTMIEREENKNHLVLLVTW